MLSDWVFTVATLVSFALIGGAAYLWRRDRKRSLLMAAAGAVLLFNVVMWSTLPAAPPPPHRQPPRLDRLRGASAFAKAEGVKGDSGARMRPATGGNAWIISWWPSPAA